MGVGFFCELSIRTIRQQINSRSVTSRSGPGQLPDLTIRGLVKLPKCFFGKFGEIVALCDYNDFGMLTSVQMSRTCLTDYK